ncbi:flap endonuclease-1 [Candidatus Woesearchaeota archaeon]|nr:flap endonuclease-1 [Candidatus Woesearchaeota archaeon]
MGVSFTDLINGTRVGIDELAGKTFVVDGYNILYQFLTTIRGPDGASLTDRKGNVTSHLVGLFSRTTKLMQEGLRLVFVFDGKAPELKKKERERRKSLKQAAQAAYDAAKESEDVAGMRKYAGRTARLTPEMVAEAKELLAALGIPTIQAPSEGEAQAAHMVKRGDAWGLISQDYDCLLFGTPRMVRNLSITQRRKQPGAFATTTAEPEVITLDDTLSQLSLSQEQLIALGLLVGTDFNVGGIKGLGPKKGLKLVRAHDDLSMVFKEAHWSEHFDFGWEEAFSLFTDMPVTDVYELRWRGVDAEAVVALLVDRHDFSADRVGTVLERLAKQGKDRSQRGLGDFF